MEKILLLIFWAAVTTIAHGQELSADKLIDMLSLPLHKVESHLLNKKYRYSGIELSGDTAINRYQYDPVGGKNKKKQGDAVARKFLRSVLNETFVHTYRTSSAAEYNSIIEALKKKGFYCEYEKDKTVSPPSYFYQHEDYTAEASIIKLNDTAWYSVSFYKKIMPVGRGVLFADDLLRFTSHEYLVYYFGANNVKNDLYFFEGKDIVKCSVLFSNTNRQVIFIWKDGLNSRRIGNLLFGGEHKLKSQQGNDKLIAESNWWLKCGINVGMPLVDLRTLNQRNIVFCGGKAPNPGLILPESTAKIDFKNKDVILGCMNCSDDKFSRAKKMYADKAMEEGRRLFILTIVLYPVENGVFQ